MTRTRRTCSIAGTGAHAEASAAYLTELAPTATATAGHLDRLADAELAELVERVRLPDGTRAPACWSHLSREEKHAITAARDATIADRACPTCRAAAGKPCTEEGQPTTIHTRRLLNPVDVLAVTADRDRDHQLV